MPTLNETFVIGVDPSAKPATSKWFKGEYSSSWVCNNMSDFEEYLNIFKNINANIILAIETAYIPTYTKKIAYSIGRGMRWITATILGKGANIKTFAIQNQNIGAIKYIGEQAGFKIIDVTPSEWQSTLGCGVHAKRPQLKRASILIASSIAKRKIITDHEADAINIGGFVARRQWQ